MEDTTERLTNGMGKAALAVERVDQMLAHLASDMIQIDEEFARALDGAQVANCGAGDVLAGDIEARRDAFRAHAGRLLNAGLSRTQDLLPRDWWPL